LKLFKEFDKGNDYRIPEINNKVVRAAEPLKYFAVYKPRGVISAASSPEGRQTVRDLVKESGRLYPVGRLDADSEGLILLTNDGELTNRLTHPRYGHQKEYKVLVAVHPEEKQLETWRRGVVLEDGYRTSPAKVWMESYKGKGAWLRVIMGEGRKRQIREIAKRIGLPVVKIIRVRISTLQVGSLKPGQSRPLTTKEINSLKEM
jgi:23S rRNA pseudouridine2605 synthase